MEKIFGASWKTTIAGIGAILAGVGNAITEWKAGGIGAVNWTVLFAAVATGVGLISAKDAGVSNATAPGPAAKVG